VAYGLDGLVLVHGANKACIDAQIDDKDADGKAFVEVRVELASGSQASGSPTNS